MVWEGSGKGLGEFWEGSGRGSGLGGICEGSERRSGSGIGLQEFREGGGVCKGELRGRVVWEGSAKGLGRWVAGWVSLLKNHLNL